MQIQNWKTKTEKGIEVYLRPIELEEAELLVEWKNSSQICEMMLRNKSTNLELEKEKIKEYISDSEKLMIGIEVNDELIGVSQIMDEFETATMIGNSEYHGQGIATAVNKFRLWYAFEQLNYPILRSIVASDEENKVDNKASIKMLESCGYVQVGKRHADMFRNGKWLSAIYLEAFNPKVYSNSKDSLINQSVTITSKVIKEQYGIVERQ